MRGGAGRMTRKVDVPNDNSNEKKKRRKLRRRLRCVDTLNIYSISLVRGILFLLFIFFKSVLVFKLF